jgi:chromosome segregation protein
MHLKSLTLKGFKSFPDSTRLDFGPGVSVVVGPNGSGKSNVTDAVLWAMGEQSPLAVRGQSMQDVIFGGGRGVQARSAAEVEIVLDNSDGTVEVPLSEISIVRRLDRTGEGSYRLNGAHCRLTDVIEVLSDTGLGKETHSVISQGRVEAIVTSKPRDRRLLIEEAAGLGKHRKRRRRAQLKLERTQENLDRALDVEREARTRLRPLKRQAEAAELHERLERQMLEARLELAREALRARGVELEEVQARVTEARGARSKVESRLQATIDRRGKAERALAERAERHDALARRVYDARSARERLGLRAELLAVNAEALGRRMERVELELNALNELSSVEAPADGGFADRSGVKGATDGERSFKQAWEKVRRVIADGVERASAQTDARARARAVGEVVAEAERLAKAAVERTVAQTLTDLRSVKGEMNGERLQAERVAEDGAKRSRRIERLRTQRADDLVVASLAERLSTALQSAGEAIAEREEQFEGELARYRDDGEETATELRACAGEEAEIQARLRAAGEVVTGAEVAAQRLRDQAGEAEAEVKTIAERLDLPLPGTAEGERGGGGGAQGESITAEGRSEVGGTAGGLDEEQAQALEASVERLRRRREQLGPVNPLAQVQYAEAVAHVEEMEGRRADLETALRELRAVIRETDRQIQETFQETFAATARNFEELVGDVFPGGSGRLRLVAEEQAPRLVLGGQQLPEGGGDGGDGDAPEAAAEAEAEAELQEREEDSQGVEIEITPAGKSMKRLSLLSGGEKSMTALAFLFAVFLARPCPFYILDEVEAALDDLNLDRFLELLRRYANRAQFIVITHQKRTMEAADWLYGVSMGGDGVSKVLSRRLPPAADAEPAPVAEVA